jgi:hydrogenase/urease accessory protein HupE
MSTAKFIKPAILLVVVLLTGATAWAHPVAQGAVHIAFLPDRVSLRARPSMEEVLVAAAYGGQKQQALPETVQSHGEYLLRHLRVVADGRALDGQVARVSGAASGRPEYILNYALANAPAAIVLQQDVLREFEYAPGNPWEATYVVRIEGNGEAPLEGLLLTAREPLALRCDGKAELRCAPAESDRPGIARQYVRHGFMHILAGYDHLLFIAGLVLAVATFWDLVKVVSAFTLAHSITLTLSVLDVVRLPGQFVEPVIAASIVFVALQNVVAPERSRGTVRLLVAFFFGLFHGLGFAGGLLQAMEGMAGAAVAWAIGGFSLGVEIGHQFIVLPLFAALTGLRRMGGGRAIYLPARAQRYGSAGICAAGVFYLIIALR